MKWQIRVLKSYNMTKIRAFTDSQKGLTIRASKIIFYVFTLFHGICHVRIRRFIANDKDTVNYDGKILKTEGRNKAAKYPQNIGLKAAAAEYENYIPRYCCTHQV